MRANDFPETELTPDTDYAALAKACGGAGATVQNLGEVADAIRWALAERRRPLRGTECSAAATVINIGLHVGLSPMKRGAGAHGRIW